MSPRRQRIGRIVGLREEELDRRVEQLASSRNAEAEARRAAELETLQLLSAQSQRARLSETVINVQQWLEVDEWLVNRDLERRAAEVRAARASLLTTRAQSAVIESHTALKKMQLLQQRLARLENLHAKRAEQRQFDELSARRLRRSLRPPR